MRGNGCGLDPLTTSVYAGDAAENCAWTMLMANNNTFRSEDANGNYENTASRGN